MASNPPPECAINNDISTVRQVHLAIVNQLGESWLALLGGTEQVVDVVGLASGGISELSGSESAVGSCLGGPSDGASPEDSRYIGCARVSPGGVSVGRVSVEACGSLRGM